MLVPKSHQKLEKLYFHGTWYKEVKKEHQKSPQDIKLKYPKASILKNNRVVFNIVGNRYRLIVKINYDFEKIYIVFFGSHQEYDKINADTVTMF